MKFIVHAYRATFEGQLTRTLLLVLGGALVAFLILQVVVGRSEALLEIPYLVAGVAGTLAPLSLLFVWNALCAPFRVERDLRKALEVENEALEAKLAPAPNLRLKIANITWGGEDAENFKDSFVSVAWVTVTNIGAMNSVARDWSFEFELDGRRMKSKMVHMDKATFMSAKGGPPLQISIENAIYEKTETIIPVGGAIGGHIIAVIPKDQAKQLGTGVTAIVSCEDALGVRSKVKMTLGESKEPIYIPGTKVVYSKE